MKQSSSVNAQLKKCQSDLLKSVSAIRREKIRADIMENNYHIELERAIASAKELSEYQKQLLLTSNDMNDHLDPFKIDEENIEKYSSQMLSAELKSTRARLLELEEEKNQQALNDSRNPIIIDTKSTVVTSLPMMVSKPPWKRLTSISELDDLRKARDDWQCQKVAD
jgi:hypothetical protein